MSVLDEAQNISGVVTAARRRERWNRQMANTTDDEKREALREAVADLEARFPELEDVPPGGAEAFARGRGHGTRSRSPVHDGRQRIRSGGGGGGGAPKSKPKGDGLGGDSEAAKGRGSGTPGLDPTARRGRRRKSTSRPTPKVDRAIQQTGIPAAVGQTTSTTMLFLGATVSLALLYLVVSSAEKRGTGAAAVPSVINGLTGALGRFLSLSDVFPSTPTPTPRAAAVPAGPTPQQRHMQSEGKKLLPQVQPLPRVRGAKRLRPIQFDPAHVTGGGGR